ncbi:hypothetical protein APY04_1864 [Hyphomicrobium sulfonivorans]|uniref:Uncharacterized protein n=1 Tax=Hyphomicrobium sulfonivorans TaxID=121290 RepID=A0A109BFB7_HYPSL|nr:hypothetical protein [Hyphomicrobium sulfonivorans]KWT67505.1 hypothetical protein APY04_1864 [Hyphomicrobium sulfonivorans]
MSDALIIAFAKLRALRLDARAELLTHAAKLPRRQRAAAVREIEAVAELFRGVRLDDGRFTTRDAPLPRVSRVTKAEAATRRNYLRSHAQRLAAQSRAGQYQ